MAVLYQTTYTRGPEVIFTFSRDEISTLELAQLRIKIMNHLPSIAFDRMITNKKIAFTKDQTFMDYFNYVLLSGSLKPGKGHFHIQAEGDRLVRTTDIKPVDPNESIKIIEDRPLFWLRANESIDMDLYVSEGTGEDHVKFRHTTEVRQNPDDHSLLIESCGILEPEEILKRALLL